MSRATERKPPRRTAQRILDTTLALFNRFGEPNVSTNLISSELGISPGNLYYHYPAKEAIVNALFDRHAQALDELLQAGDGVHDIEDAWFFLHRWFELIWDCRFLYRDLNDLLSRNRHLEQQVGILLQRKTRALRAMLQGLAQAGSLRIETRETEALGTSMVVLVSYWLSFEYARAPRTALEPELAQAALTRGAKHVLQLLAPWLAAEQHAHLFALAAAYEDEPR